MRRKLVRRDIRIAATAVLASMVLAACATGPARNVTASTAELTASGILGATPLDVYFQYAPADVPLSNPTAGSATPVARLGAFSNGTYTAGVKDLVPGTRYHFRVCGSGVTADDGAPAPGCLGERTFTTDTIPKSADTVQITASSLRSGNSVSALFWPYDIDVDLRAGAAGENPTGVLSFGLAALNEPFTQRPIVNCVAVRGNTAVIAGTTDGALRTANFAFFATDNGGAGDTLGFNLGGLPPPDPRYPEYAPPPSRAADDCSPQREGEHQWDQGIRRAAIFDALAG